MRLIEQIIHPRRGLGLTAAMLLVTASFSPNAFGQSTTPKPPADVIVFANGDQLTGTLERGAGDSVVFKSDMAGEITVPFAKIKELRANGKFAVLRKDAPVTRHPSAATGSIAFADKQLTVTPPSGAPQSIAPDKIGYILDQPGFEADVNKKVGPLSNWNGALTGGASIVRATDYGETFNAGIALVRTTPGVSWLPARDRTTFNLQETYGKLTSPVIPPTVPATPAAVTLTSIFHTDAEQDEYFSPKLYVLGQTAFDHNYAQGLKLQQLYGGGIGWTAIKTDKQQFDLKATVQYEKQSFQAAANNQNLIGSTISEAYHRNLPHKLVFSEVGSVLPAWNNTNAYSANGSATLALPVFKRLSLTVTTSDSYLNDPSAGYNKNSYQFVTAISYALK